ncbi:MAG: XRE family transcriptional regulator [Cytophagia bacterium]|nr:MAG: XRE family transcriptional regulator [Cytophagales bacterium]TAG36849.1 MAG: XRE family transcriptional regulator [Cytophagia bacterium]TAG84409.1 MAG: XRE family transcriptional regulator [Cytophagales bacterium]
MLLDTDRLKLIFGLKVRQLRQQQGITLSTLADRSGVSVSYLNEIESGKKYPKSEKVLVLAQALGTDYDTLVSMKLNKALEPVAALLKSPVLQQLPLEIFGIQPTDLLEILAQSPNRFSAFIRTITELSQHYGIDSEQFFSATLRSVQALHDNYFGDIEQAAESFLAENVAPNEAVNDELLAAILRQKFGFVIETFDKKTQPQFSILRSVFLSNHQKLLINEQLTPEQRFFTLGREIGYQVLQMHNRPLVSSVLEITSFEQMFNNFRASYFAGCLLISQAEMSHALNGFLRQTQWNDHSLLAIMAHFKATPEMLMQRVSNVLTSHFKINQLFLVRFDNVAGRNFFLNSKSLHLTNDPQTQVALREHYCRRSVSLRVLQEIATQQQNNTWNEQPLCRAQIVTYHATGTQYLIITLAKPSPPKPQLNSSVSLGLLIDDQLRALIGFLNDPALPQDVVGPTCERCALANCAERVVPPIWVKKQEQIQAVQEKVALFNKKNDQRK